MLQGREILSVVEDTFQLSERSGIVVTPGIPRAGEWRVRAGDSIVVERPDGTTIGCTLTGIEMLSPPHPNCIPILLRGMTKDAVPIGSKLWVELKPVP